MAMPRPTGNTFKYSIEASRPGAPGFAKQSLAVASLDKIAKRVFASDATKSPKSTGS